MWLKFGLDKEELICIEDVSSGKTSLKCPYCGQGLTAKKGKVKEHHFAHNQETCRPVAKREFPTLPLYENFNVSLSGKELEILKLLWEEYGLHNLFISPDLVPLGLSKAGLLQKNVYTFPPTYEFTNLGKIPVGALELTLFNEVQEPLILKSLLKLELAAEHALHKNASDLLYRLTDLKLYRTQLQRILSRTLYFLEIQMLPETLYKIGVTKRPLDERITEIKVDLSKYYQAFAIEVLGTWKHRGNVELYFKYRYRDFNYPIKDLTEYYKFNNEDAERVLHDLQHMQPKVLSSVEQDILNFQETRGVGYRV